MHDQQPQPLNAVELFEVMMSLICVLCSLLLSSLTQIPPLEHMPHQ